ncbi:IS3 family transposase [Cellulomonas sp. C5510]|nr:IS3 family transposase [Cellulomonas sp. C5510]
MILTDAIREVHAASRGIYGVRRVHAELTLGRGLTVWQGTVAMLMQRAGLKGIGGRPKWRRPHPDLISTDMVDRRFRREGLDQLWVTDITEHHTPWIPAVVATRSSMRCRVKQPFARLGCPSRGTCGAGR